MANMSYRTAKATTHWAQQEEGFSSVEESGPTRKGLGQKEEETPGGGIFSQRVAP